MENNNSIDLTEDYTTQKSLSFEQKPYDSRPHEDKARKNIAYLLIGLLIIVILWALVSISVWPDREPQIKNVIQLILSPLIALVSAATGFYYGSKK